MLTHITPQSSTTPSRGGNTFCSHNLYYYKSPSAHIPLGHIDVSDASLYLNTDKANSMSLAYFTVGVTNREYRLMAENGDTMLAWLNALQAERQIAIDDESRVQNMDSISVQIPMSAAVAATNTIGSFDPRDAAAGLLCTDLSPSLFLYLFLSFSRSLAHSHTHSLTHTHTHTHTQHNKHFFSILCLSLSTGVCVSMYRCLPTTCFLGSRSLIE